MSTIPTCAKCGRSLIGRERTVCGVCCPGDDGLVTALVEGEAWRGISNSEIVRRETEARADNWAEEESRRFQ